MNAQLFVITNPDAPNAGHCDCVVSGIPIVAFVPWQHGLVDVTALSWMAAAARRAAFEEGFIDPSRKMFSHLLTGLHSAASVDDTNPCPQKPTRDLEPTQKNTFFVASARVELSPGTTLRTVSVRDTATATLFISKVGTSSFSLVVRLVAPVDGTDGREGRVLGEVHLAYIQVGLETRRSVPLSEAQKEMLLRHCCSRTDSSSTSAVHRVTAEVRSSENAQHLISTCSMIYRPSHSDPHGHMNQNVFVGLVVDAVQQMHKSQNHKLQKGNDSGVGVAPYEFDAVLSLSINYLHEVTDIGAKLTAELRCQSKLQEEGRDCYFFITSSSISFAGSDGTIVAAGHVGW